MTKEQAEFLKISIGDGEIRVWATGGFCLVYKNIAFEDFEEAKLELASMLEDELTSVETRAQHFLRR